MSDQIPPVPSWAADGTPPPFPPAQPPSAAAPGPQTYLPPPAPLSPTAHTAAGAPSHPPYQPPAPAPGPVQPYGSPYGYGQTHPVYPSYAPPRPSSGLAIASMICGIVGFVSSPFIAVALFPLLIPLAAVVLGHMALRQLKARPEVGGKGMAVTGLILGYIPIAISVLLLILAIFAIGLFGAFALPFLDS